TPSVHVHWLRCYVLPPPLLPPCPTLFPYTTLFRSMVVPSRDRPPSASTVGTTTRLAATTPASGATPGRRAAAVSSRRSSPREAKRPAAATTSSADQMITVRPRASRTRALAATATTAPWCEA